MPAASVIAVILSTAPASPALVALARPALVPHAVTTRVVDDAATAAAHETHLVTAGFRVDTVCDGSYCVEELRAGRRVLIGAAAALRALRHEVADPGFEDEVDATEIVLPQPSAGGMLSVIRIESDYTAGAAHARNHAACETYATGSGRRVTLRDAVGARAAARIAAAAGGDVRASSNDLLVPAAGVVVLCGLAGDFDRAASPPIVVEVPR